ncbi:MAG: ABC transporter permease [Muribaculaceae bacterium]|nr:ABC transporter permease [Muribaculaceae bacterium]
MKSYFTFLRRNKAYAAIDIFGLAISMMFVVIIGGYTWQELHTDRQHSKADRMYYLGLDWDGKKIIGSHWYLQFLLKDKYPEIESSTALYRATQSFTYDNRPIETNCYFVDSTFYDIFDFKLIQGDPNTVLDNPANIVVTREYARKVWGDEDPIGKSIQFDSEQAPLVVAGVMEPMKNTALMTQERKPVDMLINFSNLKHWNSSLVDSRMGNAADASVIVLAKEGHDLTKREKEYEEAIKEDFWILNVPQFKVNFKLYPFKGSYFSDMTSNQLNFGNINMIKLLFSVGVVILIFAIMNYINLTVALAGKRAKEMATRRLLGEDRLQIICRLIAESTLLCAFSMILGIALGVFMCPYAEVLLNTPIDLVGCITPVTISLMICILLIMGVASGIIPALLLSSMKPIDAVKGAIRRKTNMIFGKIFIVVQNVVTITMIACALTMYLQVRHLINAPLGYNMENIMDLPYQHKDGNDKGMLFKDELLKLPCVEKVSFSQGVPHSRGNNNTFTYEGRTISMQEFKVDTVFMDILGIKIKKDHNLADTYKNYLNPQAINELGLKEDATDYSFGGHTYPLGGIIEDVKIGNVLTEQHPLLISEGRPFEDVWPWNVLIKVKGDEQEALEQVKEVYERIYSKDTSDSVFERPFMRQQIEEDFKKEKTISIILTIFALIAIMISMLGLIAMSTYYVRQRSLDIAVHKVMGGTSKEVTMKLVRTFMLYVVIASILAIPFVYYIMNDWLSQFSYRISIYWWIYASCALLAIIICFISVVSQCSKAANVNPINSLK